MKNFFEGGRGLCYFKPLSHLFKSKNNRSCTLFSFVLSLICVLFSVAQAQSAGERADAGGPTRLFKKFRWLLAVFVFALPMQTVLGQFYKPSSLTIRKGEQLSADFMNVQHRAVDMSTGDVHTIKLADHRDKLIILDFWASWCGPCRISLAKMNEISKQMDAKKIIVLGVNYELIDKVQTVRKDLDIHFSSIFADTLLSKSFPHRGIPHMVWIKDGKVIGIPEDQYVDLAAVKLAVESGLVNIPEKRNDRMLDPQKNLFSEGNGISPIIYQADGLQIYASNAEYIYEPIKRIETQDSIIFYGNNIAIPRLIHSLYKDDLFVPFKRYPSNFMELENGLTSSLLRNKEAVGIKASYAKGDYNEDNEARWLRSIVESYFLQHHNLETKVAHATKERYAVLKRKEPLDAVRSTMQSTSSKAGVFQDSGHKVYTSLPFGVHFINVLEARLAKIPGLDLTVLELVDRSGMDKLLLVDFEMPIAIDGLHELNKGIAKYGLQVEIEEGWADKVFVNYGKGGKND